MSTRIAARLLTTVRLPPVTCLVGGLLVCLGAGVAHAVNPAFQAFFFDVCTNPGGVLATRCAETPGGGGDLSGDSESSLNPSQTLSSVNASRSNARARGRVVRERADRETADGGTLELGPFSLLLNGRVLGEELDRRIDVDRERGHDLDTQGLQAGLDYRVNERWLIGAWLAWEDTALDFVAERPGVNFVPARAAGEVQQDGIGVSAFASGQLGAHGYVDLSAGLLDSDYEVERNAVFQESTRTVTQTAVHTRGRADGREYWVAASMGYGLNRATWNLSPYVGAVYSRARIDGYREIDLNASGLAMAFGSMTSKSLLAQAGARLSVAISRPGYVVLPQVSVEYLRELESNRVSTTAAFLADPADRRLRLTGDDRNEGFFDLGAGLVLLLPNGWMPYLEYQTTAGDSDLDRQRIAIGLRVEL